jgi:5-methylthioadenosine/S-adenosylhomocysteine deaminase
MPRLLIRNVSVVIVPESGDCRVDESQDIHINDGQITAIVPTGTAPESERAEAAQDADPTEVVEGTGLIAVPGLVNSHTHSPMVMMRGAAEDLSIEHWFNQRIWPMEVNLTPERVRVGARLACAEMPA